MQILKNECSNNSTMQAIGRANFYHMRVIFFTDQGRNVARNKKLSFNPSFQGGTKLYETSEAKEKKKSLKVRWGMNFFWIIRVSKFRLTNPEE